MNDVHESVLDAIDEVFDVLDRKAQASEDDHETDPELGERVATFATRFDEHCPPVWDDLDPVGRGRALALVLAGAGEARRATVVDLIVRWLERRVAEQASAN